MTPGTPKKAPASPAGGKRGVGAGFYPRQPDEALKEVWRALDLYVFGREPHDLHSILNTLLMAGLDPGEIMGEVDKVIERAYAKAKRNLSKARRAS